jgi:uncharacterized protein YoxC|tara:strand:+ start:347 stop:1117 length:771 start_codon:yes stop_codon:yes gene_type:complete
MPLIDLDLFNPSGCETPPLPFSPEQIEVLKSVVDGTAFENPVAGVVNQVNSAAVAAVSKVDSLRGNVNDIFGKLPDISDALEDLSAHISDFSQHADRLSGVTDVGNLGDLPGLAGLNSLASNINNVKNSIEQDTFGEDVVDHYSAMFSSILGPGSTLFEGANALIEGDLEAFLGQVEASGNVNFSKANSILNSINQIGEDIQNIIESDNDYALAAIDYLAKVSLGTSVLSMVEDPCFGQKLLQQVVKPDIKGLLNI